MSESGWINEAEMLVKTEDKSPRKKRYPKWVAMKHIVETSRMIPREHIDEFYKWLTQALNPCNEIYRYEKLLTLLLKIGRSLK